MFVPIVQVIVEPVQNANKPGIEKTTRTERCPAYLVKCFKRQWGVTAKVTSVPITDENDMWEVPQMAGFSLIDSEIQRCRQKFPRGLFDSVYGDPDAFAEAFNASAVAENPHLANKHARDDENRDAAVARATKAVLRAAGDAELQAKRARPGRPSKTKVADPVGVPGSAE